MSDTTSQAAGGPPPRGRARQLSSSPLEVVVREQNAASGVVSFTPVGGCGTLRPAAV